MQQNKKVFASALISEATAVNSLIDKISVFNDNFQSIYEQAKALVENMRSIEASSQLEAFLKEYSLETNEGVVIMCLAEALLRIPDSETADKLIHDKLKYADFEQHMGESDSLLVNASTWGLLLSGKVVNLGEVQEKGVSATFGRLISKLGEPVIRNALKSAMKIIGGQFVLGETIESAISNAKKDKGYLHSFDILGEAARTQAQASSFHQAYLDAIDVISAHYGDAKSLYANSGISVKISALDPRYEPLKREQIYSNLFPRLVEIVEKAAKHNINITLDAEEAFRLGISLELFDKLLELDSLKGFEGLGIAVQAYQKRAYQTVEHIVSLSQKYSRRVPVRLVKGAYWDYEIKRAQIMGLEGYPVFTVKQHTDISYIAVMEKMFAEHKHIYPQIATHNSLSIAAAIEISKGREFEFQRLHGMGEKLYDQIKNNYPCRVYAPVGRHEELLAYLIRRLLENGANTSFVHLLVDNSKPYEELLQNPIYLAVLGNESPNPKIPLPKNIYQDRLNSRGFELGYKEHLEIITKSLAVYNGKNNWEAHSIINGENITSAIPATICDKSTGEKIGTVYIAPPESAEKAVNSAEEFFHEWCLTDVSLRAEILEKAADIMDDKIDEAVVLLIKEAGKNLSDAMGEFREAIDFMRYYANLARSMMSKPALMGGYTGERNELSYHGRGVFVCISPWNFPLAIFTGQIAAALVTGNTVVAKPAEQTPLIASFMVNILHEAGIPKQALHILHGEGSIIGAKLTSSAKVSGVVFTGSTDTANIINKSLASRSSKYPIPVFIAETGGLNAMIVDSTALPEQVVDDVIISAFNSAGQRCSALRVLYLQEEIAGIVLAMLEGAIAELEIGDTNDLSTDIGAVIDIEARNKLFDHIYQMKSKGKLLFSSDKRIKPSGDLYVLPHVFEVKSIHDIGGEVFGPILHVIRYKESDIDKVISEINSVGYGLTLGVHSRIENMATKIRKDARVGNLYINRSMIGAVVGTHPFGGENLSGTGFKAGGPNYLMRFVTERTFTVNTAAIGGNLELLS